MMPPAMTTPPDERLAYANLARQGAYVQRRLGAAALPRLGVVAVLLGSTDISSASGLEPGSLERALTAPVSAEGDGAPLRNG